jgi:hypothetical protein
MRNPALAILAGICAGIVLCSTLAQAQSNQLPLGRVNGPVRSVSCPDGFAQGSACYAGTVSCADTNDLGFVYGVSNPRGSRGTIVFFNGGDGTTAGFQQFVEMYVNSNFQTVQVVWDTPWEDTGAGTGNSLKSAACRPATVMDWLLNQKNAYSGGGMCAQGASAGSAAVAYALSEYGAYEYLNHVELQSGPVLSDVSVGCNANSSSMSVCSGNQCLTGEQGSWPDLPTYVDGAETAVSNWTGAFGNNACNSGDRVPQSQYTAWKQMSIVDGLNDSTFTYPRTSITGWLCSKPGSCNGSWCQNNSAAQGQLFYQNVTTSKQVYRVDNCLGTEGTDEGTVPALDNQSGLQAIVSSMENQCSQNSGRTRSGPNF